MKDKKIQVNGGGIGLFGALTVLFVGLKLGHVIAWSWWWVLAPVWGPFAVILGIAAIALIVMGMVSLFG